MMKEARQVPWSRRDSIVDLLNPLVADAGNDHCSWQDSCSRFAWLVSECLPPQEG